MHDLQAIIDGLPGIYLIVAADAQYTMVASSDERLRVTMTRREDVIDKPLFEVFSDQQPDDPNSGAATLRRSLQQVIATGQTQRLTQVRYAIRRPDSSGGGLEERFWNAVNAPVKDAEGQVRYIIHRVEDVTAQRHARELARAQLQESDERLNAALLVSGTGTFYWQLASQRIDMDTAMLRLMGMEGFGEIYLSDLLERVHHQDRERMVLLGERCARSGEDFEMHFRVLLGQGERWLFGRAMNVRDQAGRPSYLVGACIDVTEHKRTELALQRLNDTLESRVDEAIAARAAAESALHQAQKMEAVGQLTSGLAHDFNNLLGGIVGALGLLGRRLDQGRHDDLHRHLASALSSADRAAALTHRLLAFSRRQPLHLRPTDANSLVDDMRELLQRTIGPLVTFDLALAHDLWLTQCDANQLENVLLNLTLNARDAMPDGGRLGIRTANQTLDGSAAARLGMTAGDYVVLSVEDTGSGIAPEKLPYVFDPFFTTKPLGAGTGLGLSMVYGFARQSGGSAQIDSTPGQGTSVCLYLPRYSGALSEQTEQTAPRQLPSSIAGRRVLVVDDEDNIRTLVCEVLEEMGHRTLQAANGVTALDLLAETGSIDLLITDIGLPGGMNGHQFAEQARRQLPDLKVLMITGYAEQAQFAEQPSAPAQEVLGKPFTLDALQTRVQTLLASTPA
ncbi:MAG: ATP-binding protein [Pseudomonadota bacterium]